MEVDSIKGYIAAQVNQPAVKPAEAKPMEAKSIEMKLMETKPMETKPLETKPAKPADDSTGGKGASQNADGAEKNARAKDRGREESAGELSLDKLVKEANKKLAGVRSEAEISVDKKTKIVMVKVINADTKEVIREIPPEKSLDALAKMWEMAGILVDEKR